MLFAACSPAAQGDDTPFWRPSYGDDATVNPDAGTIDPGTGSPGGTGGTGTGGTGGTGGGGSDAGSSQPPGDTDAGGPTPPVDAGTTTPPGSTDAGTTTRPPPVDAGGTTPPVDAGTTTPPTGTCSVSVSVTTVSPGGRYSPKNVYAIWIANSSGAWVKSLNVLASQRITYLTKWNADTRSAGSAANKVDAITGATMSSHGTRTATWNCKDLQEAVVADGSYKVCFELTDADSTGPNDCVAFTKGATGATVSPPDTATFTNRSIVFKP